MFVANNTIVSTENGLQLAESIFDEIYSLNSFIKISKNELQNLLNQLEIYANKCFVNTQRHLNAIETLNTPLELIEYNYTLGYPDKVVIE